jgi:hypothetical protein
MIPRALDGNEGDGAEQMFSKVHILSEAGLLGTYELLEGYRA